MSAVAFNAITFVFGLIGTRIAAVAAVAFQTLAVLAAAAGRIILAALGFSFASLAVFQKWGGQVVSPIGATQRSRKKCVPQSAQRYGSKRKCSACSKALRTPTLLKSTDL